MEVENASGNADLGGVSTALDDGKETEGHGLVGACPSRGNEKRWCAEDRLTNRCSSPAGRR
ncbi:hypothetical protein IPC127_06620 [Pseudomonas aeruginosa]|nr:hypothetical protein IPC128_07600 [Pseudomonas aeruginosa]TEO42505.1 hypothetical protein IPC127_06620 [Pseudomonas aeruginosa]